MVKPRSHSVAFKRQVAEEFIAGETSHALSKRHDISRQLIRNSVGKFKAGSLDDDVQAADLLQGYEAKIALERTVGRQAWQIEMLKRALKQAPRPRRASASLVTGPVASRSAGDANGCGAHARRFMIRRPWRRRPVRFWFGSRQSVTRSRATATDGWVRLCRIRAWW